MFHVTGSFIIKSVYKLLVCFCGLIRKGDLPLCDILFNFWAQCTNWFPLRIFVLIRLCNYLYKSSLIEIQTKDNISVTCVTDCWLCINTLVADMSIMPVVYCVTKRPNEINIWTGSYALIWNTWSNENINRSRLKVRLRKESKPKDGGGGGGGGWPTCNFWCWVQIC